MLRPLTASITFLFFSLLLLVLFHTNTFGQDIQASGSLSYDESRSETFNKSTGEKTEGKSSIFRQGYQLGITRNILPTLTIKGGGNFSRDYTRSEAEGVESKTTGRTIRPFLGLNMITPPYSAGFSYYTTESKRSGTGTTRERSFLDELRTDFNWTPGGLPMFNFNYARSHIYDDPNTVNRFEDLLGASTRYNWKNLNLNYGFSSQENEDVINDFKSRTLGHEGRASYGTSFYNNRIRLSTSYVFSHSKSDFSGEGTGLFALILSAGLFSLDDTPDDAPALASIPSLIDGNTGTSTGIDIGLDGDDTTLTNIGIDFGVPQLVDTLFLWVDRNLPGNVAGAFAWSIYVSPDNTDASTWTLHATVDPAPFGIIQNRFEISFPVVETRFIKIVTRPLSPAVTIDPLFQNIFVTEMESFITVSGQDESFTNQEHAYNLTLSGDVSEKTSTGYSLSYQFGESDPFSNKRTRIANTIFLSHIFNRVFIGNASASREDARDTGKETGIYTYNAGLRADYLDTFQQRLTYSGSNTHTEEETDKESSYTNNLQLRNNFELYRGWTAFLDFGYGWAREVDGGRRTGENARLATEIVPNPKTTLNAGFSITRSTVNDPDGESSQTRKLYNASLFYLPVRTLSLFAKITHVEQEESSSTLQEYQASWLPFPDGELQFTFFYRDQLSSENDLRQTIKGASARLDIIRGVHIEADYSVTTTDSTLNKDESDNVGVSLTFFL